MLNGVSSSTDRTSPLFRALLKHWRSARGMSQLDLAVAAEVSGRHLSFLETGRAQPSREMILRLGAALDLSLRDHNDLLAAASLSPVYSEAPDLDGISAPVERAIARMLEQQEPFPMGVMDRRYDLVRMNGAAVRVLSRFVAEPDSLEGPPNALRMIFDPRQVRPHVLGWPCLARELLSRLQREALGRPQDDALRALISDLLRYPGVPDDWHQPDLEQATGPTLNVALARDGIRLEFFTTLTVFNEPRDVPLQELTLASYLPADPETEAICRQLAEA